MVNSLSLLWQPRMLMTVDEHNKPISVPVRVGQAVDVVGQAGRPKTITGFQTHTTPVLLAAGDRAELATEKYAFSSMSSFKKKKKKVMLLGCLHYLFSFLVDIFHYPLFWKGSLSWRRILIIGKKITKVGSRNILRLWPNSFPSFHRGYNFLKIWFVINLIVPCKSTNLSCSVFLPSRKYNAYKDHIKLSRIYLLGKTSLKEKFLITI